MQPSILSYRALRLVIGVLAFMIVIGCVVGGLVFGNGRVEEHISAYYYTNMQDYMESILMGVGMFLLCYFGYTKIDRLMYSITGLMAIGVACFPFNNGTPFTVGIFNISPVVSGYLHVICAALFFALLAYNSYFVFTKTDPLKTMTPQKVNRNKVYRICGITIAVALALFGICSAVIPPKVMTQYCISLYFETIMLFSFGVSWLTKGEFIFRDK